MTEAQIYLSQLPRVPKASLDDEDKHCVICKEEFESRTTVSHFEQGVKLHCSHMFGLECLRSWAKNQNSCPTCRRPIITKSSPTDIMVGENDNGDGWMQNPDGRRRADELRQYLHHLLYGPTANLTSENFDTARRHETRSVTRPWLFHGRTVHRMGLFRERLLYRDLQNNGVPLPEVQRLESIEEDHEHALFQALEGMGVFDRSWQNFTPMLDRREMWNILREEGFVWDLERDSWVAMRYGTSELGCVRVV